MIYKFDGNSKTAALTPPSSEVVESLGQSEYLAVKPFDGCDFEFQMERWGKLGICSARWFGWASKSVAQEVHSGVVIPERFRPIHETQGVIWVVNTTGNFHVLTDGSLYWWIQNGQVSGGSIEGGVVYACTRD